MSILDGPDAGRSAVTDADGRYVLADLQPATVNLRATADNYDAKEGGMVLDEHRQMSFQLVPTGDGQVWGWHTIGPCAGTSGSSCFSKRFDLHRPGPIDVLVFTEGSGVTHAMNLTMVHLETGFARVAFSLPHGQPRRFYACTGCPAGRWEFILSGALPNTRTLYLEINHPR